MRIAAIAFHKLLGRKQRRMKRAKLGLLDGDELVKLTSRAYSKRPAGLRIGEQDVTVILGEPDAPIVFSADELCACPPARLLPTPRLVPANAQHAITLSALNATALRHNAQRAQRDGAAREARQPVWRSISTRNFVTLAKNRRV